MHVANKYMKRLTQSCCFNQPATLGVLFNHVDVAAAVLLVLTTPILGVTSPSVLV